MDISIVSHGTFDKAISYLERLRMLKIEKILDAAGQKGVEALRAATPRDSGDTANMWSYTITFDGSRAKLEWHNSNIESNYNIALLIQYGHGTNHGGYVPPHDYINPALDPVFQDISRQVGEEVKRI